MPKSVKPTLIKSAFANEVPVQVYEWKATTKDKDKNDVSFTYQANQYPDTTTLEQLAKSLTYKDSKGTEITGQSQILDAVNVKLQNAGRSSEVNRINGIQKMREDPEAAFKAIVDMLVLVKGVPRDIAEKNVRATMNLGTIGNEPKPTTQPTA